MMYSPLKCGVEKSHKSAMILFWFGKSLMNLSMDS